MVADACGNRTCCSQAITVSSHRICESQGHARYRKSARARNVAMCQSHSQNPYRRRARNTMIVTVNAMPNPFCARAPRLVCTKRSRTRTNGGRRHFVPLYTIARDHAVVASTSILQPGWPLWKYFSARIATLAWRKSRGRRRCVRRYGGIGKAGTMLRRPPKRSRMGPFRQGVQLAASGIGNGGSRRHQP